MSTSQTRDGKNYACYLSRKVHSHANGNRHWRDAIKHPASAVRSHSLLGDILENLGSLPGRYGGVLLKSKSSDPLWEHVFWSSSCTHHLTVWAGFAVMTWGLVEDAEGKSGILDTVVQDVTWAVSACCEESSKVTYPTLGTVISDQLSHFGSASPTARS